MPSWVALIVVGVILYAITTTEAFPQGYAKGTRIIGGFLAFVGVILLTLALLNVPLPR